MSASNLQTVLSGNNVINQSVYDRIHLAPAPQNTNTPHITYEYDSSDPIKNLSGVTNLKCEDWTNYITDKNFTNGNAIKSAVIDAISSEKVLFNASIQDEDYEKDEEAQTHRFEINYTIYYY